MLGDIESGSVQGSGCSIDRMERGRLPPDENALVGGDNLDPGTVM